MKRFLVLIAVIGSTLAFLFAFLTLVSPVKARPIGQEPPTKSAQSVTQLPNIKLNVDYNSDSVLGEYAPGSTIWLTLTNSLGDPKAIANAVSTVGGAGGPDGITIAANQWDPPYADILPGDYVQAKVNGLLSTVEIGDIVGNIDLVNDTITGTINAPSATPPVPVMCYALGSPSTPNIPSTPSTINPDGTDVYNCNWGVISPTWDITAGQDIGIIYTDGLHTVFNKFHVPTPHLRLWVDFGGQPIAGNNYIFRVHYQNLSIRDAAENVKITMSLSGFLTYLEDTAPVSVTTPSAGMYRWSLGQIPPNTNSEFEIFVAVAPGATGVSANFSIATNSLYNTSLPNELFDSFSSVAGQTSQTDYDVNFYAHTPYPAPGHTYEYEFAVCNQGVTAGNEVVFTNTLPTATTYQSWSSANQGWAEVSNSSSEVVLERPSIFPGECQTLYLMALVDAQVAPHTVLTNSVAITSASDINWGNNAQTKTNDVAVPLPALSIDHFLVSGKLITNVPEDNGYMVMRVTAENIGNIPIIEPHITATVPPNTIFGGAWMNQAPFPPAINQPSYVHWNLAPIANGEEVSFDIKFLIEGNAPTGTITSTILFDAPNAEDVTSEVPLTIHEAGPNLRLEKHGYWSPMDPEQRAFYEIWVQNVGSTDFAVTPITDTYPFSMSMGSQFWSEGGVFSWQNDAPNHTFTATLNPLPHGESVQILYDSWVSGTLNTPYSLENTVEGTTANDVMMEDNVATAVLAEDAGAPDLYVLKSTEAMTNAYIGPWGFITYTIEYGNNGVVTASNAILTDSLPSSLVFVTATMDILSSSTNSGIVWDLGDVPSNSTGVITVVAFITETYGGGNIVNYAQISNDFGDSYPFDNQATAVITTPLDIALNMWSSHPVAMLNSTIVYTLEVANLSNAPAHNVRVLDFLPEGLAYQNASSTDGSCFLGIEGPVCTTGLLAPYSSFYVRITATGTMTGSLSNNALVRSDTPDLYFGNNFASYDSYIVDDSAPFIFAVEPSYALNDQETIITIYGANFSPTNTVYLNRYTYTQVMTLSVSSPYEMQAVVPAGAFAGGLYDVKVASWTEHAILPGSFTLLKNQPPYISDVSPDYGPSESPVVIDISGDNFGPEMTATLTLTGSGASYVLYDVYYEDPQHAFVYLPESLEMGTYNLTLNHVGGSTTLNGAYTAVDIAQQPDFALYNQSFTAFPPGGPVAGAPSTLAVKVYRSIPEISTTYTQTALVEFYETSPYTVDGGTLIGSQWVTFTWQDHLVATTTWTPTLPGYYEIYAVVDPDQEASEYDEGNNIARRGLNVRLPHTGNALTFANFVINDGRDNTIEPSIHLNTLLNQPPNPAITYLLYQEYTYDPNLSDWVPVASSEWIPYNIASSNYPWQLQASWGIHYMQVWAMDELGNVSFFPAEQFVNLLPTGNTSIAHGNAHVYRFNLRAGQSYRLRLTTLSGDTDLYIWRPDGTLGDTSQHRSAVDEFVFTALSDAVYQVEVLGIENSVYKIEVLRLNAPLTAPTQSRGHVKGSGSPFLVVGSNPDDNSALPNSPSGLYTIYLPTISQP